MQHCFVGYLCTINYSVLVSIQQITALSYISLFNGMDWPLQWLYSRNLKRIAPDICYASPVSFDYSDLTLATLLMKVNDLMLVKLLTFVIEIK